MKAMITSQSPSEEISVELSSRRTGMSFHRTRMSADRTLMSVLRTSLSLIGFGAGKVWKAGTTTCNLFAEPQWTVAHDGSGVPKFQVFFGLNLQFPL